jgi:CubicO group peptidase (beta-lactamase class C family)
MFGDMKAVPVEQTASEIDRVIASAQTKALKSKPGEEYVYSNFGYCLLGYIIEKVSGELYASFLNTHVFGPLGMTNTLYDDPRPIIKDRADGYIRKEGQLINDNLKDPAAYAAGGLLSTTADFLLFDQALYTNQLLSPAGLSTMFTAYKNEFGGGWKVTTQLNRPVYNFNGSTHGFSSHIVRYPNERLLIVVLSNVENERPQGVACNLAEIVFGIYRSPIKVKKETLSKYAGEYADSSGLVRVIKLAGENLVYQVNDNLYNLVPLAQDEFYVESADETRFRFVPAQGGIEMIRTSCGKEDLKLRRR